MRLRALMCLPIVFTGCARDPDGKVYGVPMATAPDIRTAVCPTKSLQPAQAVACPEFDH